VNNNTSPGPISVRSGELTNLSLTKLLTFLQRSKSSWQQSAVLPGKCRTGDTPYFSSQRRIEIAAYRILPVLPVLRFRFLVLRPDFCPQYPTLYCTTTVRIPKYPSVPDRARRTRNDTRCHDGHVTRHRASSYLKHGTAWHVTDERETARNLAVVSCGASPLSVALRSPPPPFYLSDCARASAPPRQPYVTYPTRFSQVATLFSANDDFSEFWTFGRG